VGEVNAETAVFLGGLLTFDIDWWGAGGGL
jgi:hypothetical protein